MEPHDLDEARAEVERLKRELAIVDDQRLSWRQAALTALEENYKVPRLRAALAVFADRGNWMVYLNGNNAPCVDWVGEEDPWTIAQAVLEAPVVEGGE